MLGNTKCGQVRRFRCSSVETASCDEWDLRSGVWVPVLVFPVYLVMVSKCSKLGSTGMNSVLLLPHHFKMQCVVSARTADLSNQQLIGARRVFKAKSYQVVFVGG